MRIGAPKVFTRTKYFYSTPTNGGYHQEALRVRVKSQVPGIPTTQVSKLASLGSGTHVGKPGDGGGGREKTPACTPGFSFCNEELLLGSIVHIIGDVQDRVSTLRQQKAG